MRGRLDGQASDPAELGAAYLARVFGVLVPIGPGPREAARFDALLSELERHENARDLRVVVVDDSPEPGRLGGGRPGLEVIRTPLWSGAPPDTLSAHVAGTLAGIRRRRGGVRGQARHRRRRHPVALAEAS